MHFRGRAAVTAGCFATLLGASAPAQAWGNEGHEVVGLIADHYLVPQARAALAQLLAMPSVPPTPGDIASRATWADVYKNASAANHAATGQWHFIDIEMQGPGTVQSACFGVYQQAVTDPFHGPANDCVTDKIEQFGTQLATAGVSAADRQIAMQFLLHLVGDVHQPLHSADNQDGGGNRTWVVWNNRTVPTDLHAFWDDTVVSDLGGANPTTVAANLLRGINQQTCQAATQNIADWKVPESWALEANQLARAHAYGMMPAQTTGSAPINDHGHKRIVQYYTLSPAYVAQANQDAALQLTRAGLRLAALLNGFLASSATPC